MTIDGRVRQLDMNGQALIYAADSASRCLYAMTSRSLAGNVT
jgi:hypothetical protein